MVKKIKYLGTYITNRRKYFAHHKELKIEKARKMANMTYSVVARSCNKMAIGKTYWKKECCTAKYIDGEFSHGLDTGGDGKVENNVRGQILGAPGYAASEAIRGEIG